MSTAAFEAVGRMYDMVSTKRGIDVTPALIDRLREDFVIVRHAMTRAKLSAHAELVDARIAALAKARGDRSAELQDLADALYGVRMSLWKS